MDNCRIHHSQDTKTKLSQMKLKPLYLPAYSSPLNSIERLWAIIKQKYRKNVCKSGGDLNAVEISKTLH